MRAMIRTNYLAEEIAEEEEEEEGEEYEVGEKRIGGQLDGSEW